MLYRYQPTNDCCQLECDRCTCDGFTVELSGITNDGCLYCDDYNATFTLDPAAGGAYKCPDGYWDCCTYEYEEFNGGYGCSYWIWVWLSVAWHPADEVFKILVTLDWHTTGIKEIRWQAEVGFQSLCEDWYELDIPFLDQDGDCDGSSATCKITCIPAGS